MAHALGAAMPASPRQRGNTLSQRARAVALAPVNRLRAALAMAWAYMLATAEASHAQAKALVGDRRGFINISPMLTLVVSIILTIIGAVIGAAVLAGLLPSFFSSGKTLTGAFKNASLDGGGVGDTTVHIFAILVAVLFALAPIGLVASIVVIAKTRGGKKGSHS